MAQVDRFLSLIIEKRAGGVLFQEGVAVQAETPAGLRPVTPTALTGDQIAGLLREIAPPEQAALLKAGKAATFEYVLKDMTFSAHGERTTKGWAATIRVSGAAAPAAPAAASVPANGGQVRVDDAAATAAADAARGKLDTLLRHLVASGSSDLHLRCGEPAIIRLSGEMQRVEDWGVMDDARLRDMLYSIMPARNRKEFDELNDTDFAYEIEGVSRYRVNIMMERKGIAAVFRAIPAQVVSVEQMGVTPEVQQLCFLSKGLVLVTGPTGSGKSTTLCALIDLVNRARTDHVITIEDPIEFVHPNKKCIITQRQVGVHTNSFRSALRAALREDPDIVLVGELRDLETVAIAIETAETGHLVFGTLHTTTAASTVDRLIDQFPADRQDQIRVMLAESLKGVISQTLCKKVGGGRVAAREILLSTPAVSNLIRESKIYQINSVMQTSRKIGMVTLNDALLDLVDNKLIEPKEAYVKAIDKPGISAALALRGFEMSFTADKPETKGTPPKPADAKAGARA